MVLSQLLLVISNGWLLINSALFSSFAAYGYRGHSKNFARNLGHPILLGLKPSQNLTAPCMLIYFNSLLHVGLSAQAACACQLSVAV